MASISEVARLAGVSTATASRVVSSADYPVSEATRARVLDAARALDYVPNALARGLLKSQIPIVAVIVHDITDPYFAEVVRGVEDAASPAGYLVITCSSERDAERETSYVRLLRSMRAASVIFAASGLDDPEANQEIEKHLAVMRGDGAAIVHLSPHALGPADVGIDNEAGMASMIAALVELGHREIAFLAGPSTLFVARARLTGYRRGLDHAGLPFDERLVIQTSFDREGGALGVDTLLGGAAPFTAIACANDNEFGLAAAVFTADTARGWRVAQRIQSGICHVNGPSVHDEAQMPFGGVKASGWGHFGGKAGVEAFTDLRWITVQTTLRHYPF